MMAPSASSCRPSTAGSARDRARPCWASAPARSRTGTAVRRPGTGPAGRARSGCPRVQHLVGRVVLNAHHDAFTLGAKSRRQPAVGSAAITSNSTSEGAFSGRQESGSVSGVGEAAVGHGGSIGGALTPIHAGIELRLTLRRDGGAWRHETRCLNIAALLACSAVAPSMAQYLPSEGVGARKAVAQSRTVAGAAGLRYQPTYPLRRYNSIYTVRYPYEYPARRRARN